MRDFKKYCWKGYDIFPTPVVDYSRQYFTFEALEDTTFTFTTNALQYSLDGGTTWTTLAANTASPTVTASNKIMWKQTGLTPNPNTGVGIGTFSATGNFSVSGNIMSLYYGDNFYGQTSLEGKDYAFVELFVYNNKVISAENLSLPATTLAESCYNGMFCNCTSLTTAPELAATTLAQGCYGSMFYACTSLTNAPELPATTLAVNCYSEMFRDCTALTTAPELPATTLIQGCYKKMFYGCRSLTTAPTLPATILIKSCYSSMFFGCTSLNRVTCLATDISASSCTNNWVDGVATSGTFVKDASMTSWTTGTSGIPEGWTVQDAA